MKKKSYKLVKCVIAKALAGIMVTSFAGCTTVKKAVLEKQDNPISLYDESGNPLCVIAFVDKGDDGSYKGDESYGYIQKDGEKIKFYDVEHDNSYNLYEGQLLNYLVYYAPFTSLLTEEDFNRALGYGSVDKSVIDAMEDKVSVHESYTGYYYIDGAFVDNYAKLEKFEPETYFVDNEQNNKEQESTTLVKNR